jgi:hypothetical protein
LKLQGWRYSGTVSQCWPTVISLDNDIAQDYCLEVHLALRMMRQESAAKKKSVNEL